MAAFGGSFQSSSSIEEKKEYKRKARQEVIDKAKQEYEEEERRKELKRQRGEDTWLLPEVHQRLHQLQQETSIKTKKKKDKKSKKSKKEKEKKKLQKKKREESGEGSSDGSEASGDDWVEAPAKAWQIPAEIQPSESSPGPAHKVQRDEWMTFDFLAMRTTSTAEKRAEKERQKEEEKAKAQAIEQVGLHKLELNPYWKDGGSGLPPVEVAGTAAQKASVNDGGVGWLRKSLQRMKEQAEREQRSLSDVVSQRYGREERPAHRGSSSPGLSRSRLPLSLGSLQGRFLKPSDQHEDGDGEAVSAPVRSSQGFLKPGSDDEDSDSVQTWRKKSGVPVQESDVPGKPEQAREKDVGKAVPAPDEGRHGDAASVTSSRSSSSSEEEEVPMLTDEEMNKLGAKLVKAELLGNTALMEKLKAQLESARQAKENHRASRQTATAAQQVPGRSEEDQEVVLFRMDQSGRAWPVNAPSGPQEPHGGRRKKKTIETHVRGERVRYFQDDDVVGLQEMVKREKMSSAQDQNLLYSRMAAKMMGKADGDNYTLDDMFESSAAQREGEGQEEERMRSRAVGESRRLAASMDKCQRCFTSQEVQKHLVVAIGTKVYLSLPGGVSMTEGHCLICPLQHHCSATGLDEDVWAEIQLFRRVLVRMFESQDLDCVFLETHMNPRRRQHMVLECLPLPRELGDMAPIYFKKAIMECDEEWSMNKKVVDLSSKDVRQAIPRGLPYFAVDFGLQGGFAHVIENEQKFPHYFGKEVVGGMLDLEPRRWRKPIRENFDDQRKKVLLFAQQWKPFDCTKND